MRFRSHLHRLLSIFSIVLSGGLNLGQMSVELLSLYVFTFVKYILLLILIFMTKDFFSENWAISARLILYLLFRLLSDTILIRFPDYFSGTPCIRAMHTTEWKRDTAMQIETAEHGPGKSRWKLRISISILEQARPLPSALSIAFFRNFQMYSRVGPSILLRLRNSRF